MAARSMSLSSLLNPEPVTGRTTPPPGVRTSAAGPSVPTLEHLIHELSSRLKAGEHISVSELEHLRSLSAPEPSQSQNSGAPRDQTPPATPPRRPVPQVSPTGSSPPRQAERLVFSANLSTPTSTQTNVLVNRKTRLTKLYTYEDVDAYLEYPETSANGIGYLFRQDPDNWRAPWHDFAYSFHGGGQRSQSLGNPPLYVSLIGNGKISCVEQHRSCQGMKACPFADLDEMRTPHSSGSLDDIAHRLAGERERRIEFDSPSRDIFRKTEGLVSGLRRLGCRMACEDRDQLEPTDEAGLLLQEHHKKLQRGYTDTQVRCQGRIVFTDDWEGCPTVACERYSSSTSREHYHQRLDDSYDLGYLEAVLSGDEDEARRIEEAVALDHNIGPSMECTMVANNLTQRLNCPSTHRHSEDGTLYQPLLKRLECSVKMRVYEPKDDISRHKFPYTLVTIRGAHQHPVPLPLKTPPRLRSHIFSLLENIGEDLADLTVRGFLRHAVVHSYVRSLFSSDAHATFSQIHPSLANRAHISSYIKAAKKKRFPQGTGWEGALHLQQAHTAQYPVKAQYIRRMIEVSCDDGENLRIIVCMNPKASHRLQKANYLQSDISFKRVAGWKEFIIAGRDRDANTAVVYCRVYLTRETAEAHRLVFGMIEELLIEDVGEGILWRHLYALSNEPDDQKGCMLLWVGDQDGAQAKGLGMHLCSQAQKLQGYDLFDENLRLSDLTVYQHVHRIFRLCTVHFARKIQEAKVPAKVRTAMRSLACLRHPNWDETIQFIRTEGGKVGNDWLDNKFNSQFAIEALSWEHSKIPECVWRSGESNDNLVEGSHSNVNLDGKGCTLVGGIEKGRRYDAMKMDALKTLESVGVRPSYASGSWTDNATKAIKRKHQNDHHKLHDADTKILKHNKRMAYLLEELRKVQRDGTALHAELNRLHQAGASNVEIGVAQRQRDSALNSFEKLKEQCKAHSTAGEGIPLGSGKFEVNRFEVS